MKTSLTVQSDLAKNLRALPGAVSLKVQRDALRVGAEPIRAEAATLAPRGDKAPHIADNIVIGIPRTGLEDIHDDAAVIAIGPEKSFFYGFFHEYGTVKMPAHPFMRPAFDTQVQRALTIVKSAMWAAVQKQLARLHTQQSAVTGASRARSTGVGL